MGNIFATPRIHLKITKDDSNIGKFPKSQFKPMKTRNNLTDVLLNIMKNMSASVPM